MSKITQALKKAEMERLKKQTESPLLKDEKQSFHPKLDIKPAEEIVFFHQPNSNIAEQYRMAKVNIERLDPKNPPRCLIITSSIKDEGKTVTAINLSLALAKDPKKTVLLVDADLRKPRVIELLGLNHKKYQGLSEMLEGFIPVDKLLLNISDNLYLLPSGAKKESSSELLTLPQAKELFSYLKKKFDWVIVDSPPVLSASDASIMGGYLDGCLLVIRAGSTQRKAIVTALDTLKQNKIKIIGFFLTNFHSHLPSYLARYYYARSYYQYYQ